MSFLSNYFRDAATEATGGKIQEIDSVRIQLFSVLLEI